MGLVKKSLGLVQVTVLSCPKGVLIPGTELTNCDKDKGFWLRPLPETTRDATVASIPAMDSLDRLELVEDNFRLEFRIAGEEPDDWYCCGMEMEMDNAGGAEVFRDDAERLVELARPHLSVERSKRHSKGDRDPMVASVRLLTVWSHETWVEDTEDGPDLRSSWELSGLLFLEQSLEAARANLGLIEAKKPTEAE